MPLYRCFFLDPADRIFGSDDLIECETDTQAQACADRLLADRGFPGVEVWDCERKVYSARKTAAPSLGRRIERSQAKPPAEGKKLH